MPELPEVECVRRSLLRAGLRGRRIVAARIGWANSVKAPSAPELAAGVAGREVLEVKRRAKYLILRLSGGGAATLLLHLGMTGWMELHPPEVPAGPMLRHCFTLDDGRELRFDDARKFGKLWLAEQAGDILPPLSPEPLSDDFTTEGLADALARNAVPIKARLLEQSVAAGLGNIYTDEALFLSGLHPERPASGLTAEETARLRQGIIAALSAGNAVYDRARDRLWPQQPREMTTWTHPRKAKAPCPQCGGPFTATRLRGRGTYYCAACQS